mgnify:CR=1 FL=1
MTKKSYENLLYVSPSGNQVDGLPLALHNKGAASTSWLRPGRACERKMTRTEGMSVRVMRMLRQLVGSGPVEQLNVKSDTFS